MRLHVTITPDETKPDNTWHLTQGLDTIGIVKHYDWPAGSRSALTPYELWTPSHDTSTPMPRVAFATLEEAATAADELAEQRARLADAEPVEVHSETYRGSELVVTYHPATATPTDSSRRPSRRTATLDGRPAACLAGDLKAIVKKLRKTIDTQRADEELRPRLRLLIDARPNVAGMPGWDDDAAPNVGDAAYVWARGMCRRGLVVHVARTRATVAYVTATNPDFVHRKADAFHELAAG